jgi:AmmeMemoRadiSam system protein B
MADAGMPETIIFIGPNHTGMGAPVGMSDQDWKTPMGIMELDRELMGSIEIPIDRSSHSREHSIEVQMPFVQFFDGNVKQVCISMLDQSLRTSIDIGNKVANAVKASEGKVSLVASSDFTHCGWAYGFPVPPSMTPGDFARSLDLPVIERLKELDLEGAFQKKEELGTTACGLGPIAAVIQASIKLGAGSVEMLDYTTSYDVDPADLAVGYASMSIR